MDRFACVTASRQATLPCRQRSRCGCGSQPSPIRTSSGATKSFSASAASAARTTRSSSFVDRFDAILSLPYDQARRCPRTAAYLARPLPRGEQASGPSASTEHVRVAGGDVGEQPPAGGAVLDVEQLLAAAVEQLENLADPVAHVVGDRVAVEGFVGQRVGVEVRERLLAADGLPQPVAHHRFVVLERVDPAEAERPALSFVAVERFHRRHQRRRSLRPGEPDRRLVLGLPAVVCVSNGG
ncbi:MAG: hypothetical protein ACRDUY_06825 [Nitriliruptorales bacterium]